MLRKKVVATSPGRVCLGELYLSARLAYRKWSCLPLFASASPASAVRISPDHIQAVSCLMRIQGSSVLVMFGLILPVRV